MYNRLGRPSVLQHRVAAKGFSTAVIQKVVHFVSFAECKRLVLRNSTPVGGVHQFRFRRIAEEWKKPWQRVIDALEFGASERKTPRRIDATARILCVRAKKKRVP